MLCQGAVIELEQLGQDTKEFVRELFLFGRLLQAFGQLQEFEESQCARQAREYVSFISFFLSALLLLIGLSFAFVSLAEGFMLSDMSDESVAEMGQEVSSCVDCFWLAARDAADGARQAKSDYDEDR